MIELCRYLMYGLRMFISKQPLQNNGVAVFAYMTYGTAPSKKMGQERSEFKLF